MQVAKFRCLNLELNPTPRYFGLSTLVGRLTKTSWSINSHLLTVVSMPKCKGLAPLVANTGVCAAVVSISREWMQKSANLFYFQFL